LRQHHFSLTYSLYGIRGWEYKFAPPRCDCSKRQRSKDYQPQKRVTLMLRKPNSCFSNLLSEGQCQVLQTTAAGSDELSFADIPSKAVGMRHRRLCLVPHTCRVGMPVRTRRRWVSDQHGAVLHGPTETSIRSRWHLSYLFSRVSRVVLDRPRRREAAGRHQET